MRRYFKIKQIITTEYDFSIDETILLSYKVDINDPAAVAKFVAEYEAKEEHRLGDFDPTADDDAVITYVAVERPRLPMSEWPDGGD